MIPYGKHSISQTDVDAVVDILENHFLTQGPKVGEFEAALCEYSGCSYATAVNSGTSALHVACLALGVGNGDVVWTVPNSFVASANCALYCGASVDFVDIDAETRNICVNSLAQKLADAEQKQAVPKAIVVVHFAGLSCEMQGIAKLADHYGFAIIEDASHALGADYLGKPVGNCQYSDLCVFSFHPVKSITTAEGGAVLTNDAKLAQRSIRYAKHGITKDTEQFVLFDDNLWQYEQQQLGFNYRLSDLHAALGISQLQKLDGFIQKRREMAARYIDKLTSLPLKLPVVPEYSQSSWHLFVVELLAHDRETVFKQLRANDIGVNVHYIPIHTQPWYKSLGFEPEYCPRSVAYYERAISLPIFPLMTEREQDLVIDALREVLS